MDKGIKIKIFEHSTNKKISFFIIDYIGAPHWSRIELHFFSMQTNIGIKALLILLVKKTCENLPAMT